MEFSPCRADDIPAVVNFVNKAYRGESSRQGWTTEASILGGQRTDERMISEMISSPGQQIWLAREDHELVGLFHLEHGAERTYLGMLTVAPSRQSLGLGRQLIQKAEELARSQWGLTELYMTVISLRRELIGYYERRGYQDTGERKDFPLNDPRFGVPLRTDFHLKILRKAF